MQSESPARAPRPREGGMPAAAPLPAVRTCPRITSDTSSGASPARRSTSRMAAAPSSCAGSADRPPLKEPGRTQRERAQHRPRAATPARPGPARPLTDGRPGGGDEDDGVRAHGGSGGGRGAGAEERERQRRPRPEPEGERSRRRGRPSRVAGPAPSPAAGRDGPLPAAGAGGGLRGERGGRGRGCWALRRGSGPSPGPPGPPGSVQRLLPTPARTPFSFSYKTKSAARTLRYQAAALRALCSLRGGVSVGVREQKKTPQNDLNQTIQNCLSLICSATVTDAQRLPTPNVDFFFFFNLTEA